MALAKLCSGEFFDDPSLLVVVSRRILEVLELAPVEEKKVRGKKKKKKGTKKKADPRKLEVLDACHALGLACKEVSDFEDATRYFTRAKEGYEEQLGPDSEKTLGATYSLISITCSSKSELIEKMRSLVERLLGALGEENVVTLLTLNTLGVQLMENGELEEARKYNESCLAGRVKVLGVDHKDTLMTVNNLGAVYTRLKDYEKGLEYYERALKGKEKTLGRTHSSTLMTVVNIASFYSLKGDLQNAADNFRKALDGNVAQLGKDHPSSKSMAKNLAKRLKDAGESKKLSELEREFPWL